MTSRFKTALVVVLAAGILGAAAPQNSAPAKPTAPAASRKPVAAKSDADIESEIRLRFSKSKVKEDNFTVKVRSGVATLEGRTNVPQRKGAATRMAKSAGAKQVNNLIQVSEEARRKAAQNLTKRRVQVSRSERD